MTLQNIWRLLRSDYLKIIPVLGLAYYIAFIPHLNYPYPLHVDEWVHLIRAKEVMQAEGINFAANLEAGFQLFWGVFQSISGISWMTIFRFFPGVIFTLTVLSVFIMARKEGFGFEAAFFTSLIPTTVGVLGPAFLVPASLGLLFTPLIMFLILNFRTVWSYALVFVLIAFLLSMHAPSAIYPVIILTPYILLNLKENFKHSLGTALGLGLPFIVIFPWIFGLLKTTAGKLLTQTELSEFVQLPRIIQGYGYIPLSICLLGIFVLAMRGGRKAFSLVLGLLAMLLMLVSYYTFHYGIWIIYERGLTFTMLLAGIIAGAGLAWIRDFGLPEGLSQRLKMPEQIARNAGKLPYLAIIIITLIVTIPSRLDTPYYHMIDEKDYDAFVWMADNIDSSYQKALLDPWKATAFAAITGRQIYTRIHSYPMETDTKAYEFLRRGSDNTSFLRQNDISIVYSRVFDGPLNGNNEYKVNNPDLIEVAGNIYLLGK